MIWIALETEFQHEGRVFDAIGNLGCEAFLPRAMVRASHRGVIRIRRPLICPGYVFAHIDTASITAALDLKFVTGAILDDSQRPYVIPDRHMTGFMAAYQEWLEAQERAWQTGQRPRRKKFRRKFKLEAGDMSALSSLLFGADAETGEIAA